MIKGTFLETILNTLSLCYLMPHATEIGGGYHKMIFNRDEYASRQAHGGIQ